MASPSHERMLVVDATLHNDQDSIEDEEALFSSGIGDDQSSLLDTVTTGPSDSFTESDSPDEPRLTMEKETDSGSERNDTDCEIKATLGYCGSEDPRPLKNMAQQCDKQNNNSLLQKQTSFGKSYITRSGFAPEHKKEGDINSKETQPAVLELQSIAIHEKKKPLETTRTDSPLQRFPLQRQTKMNSPTSENPVQEKKMSIMAQHLKSKINIPLRPTMSLNDKVDPAEEKQRNDKLGKQGQHWASLEVPFISVCCEEDDDLFSEISTENFEPQNHQQTGNSQTTIDSLSDNDITGEHTAVPSRDHNSAIPKRGRQSLALNVQPHTIGRSSGIKLKGTYSLDVPEPHILHPSHSMNAMHPPRTHQRRNSGKIEDKLIISTSPTGLEASRRRRSWAPGSSPRGSNGSIYDILAGQ